MLAGHRQRSFRDVFDLEVGERPAAIRRIPGCWLYPSGRPLVHIIGSHGFGEDHAAEAIDHVGLRMTDYDGFRARLDDMVSLIPRWTSPRSASVASSCMRPAGRCSKPSFPNQPAKATRMTFDQHTVSVIVGGTSGIGKAIAEALSHRPGRVEIASRATGLDIGDTAAGRTSSPGKWLPTAALYMAANLCRSCS